MCLVDEASYSRAETAFAAQHDLDEPIQESRDYADFAVAGRLFQ